MYSVTLAAPAAEWRTADHRPTRSSACPNMFYVRLWRKKFREMYRPATCFVRYPSEAIRNVDFIVEELHRRSGFVAEREAKAAECRSKCECQRELQLAELLRAIGPCKERVPGNGGGRARRLCAGDTCNRRHQKPACLHSSSPGPWLQARSTRSPRRVRLITSAYFGCKDGAPPLRSATVRLSTSATLRAMA